MKVCTDACILGAWTANKLTNNRTVNNILDIGCGTGLLSLMLAQNTAAQIDAIEINTEAAGQAKKNVQLSPWNNTIQVINIPVQQFRPDKKYDLIICNPPFFEDQLRSDDIFKNESKHDTSLRLEELVNFIKQHITPTGHAVILIPFQRTDYLAEVVKNNGLFITDTLFIKQSTSHSYFRTILQIANINRQPIETNELIIHDHERNYTAAFIELLSHYYLNL